MIRLLRVSKKYPGMDRSAVRGVSFSMEQGEWAYLIGPSGAGKSTLLKLLYRAITPDEGEITVVGQDVQSLPAHALRRRMGVMFQSFELLPTKTVYENVAFGAEVQGIPPRKVRGRAMELLDRVGLADKRNRFPAQLSGGEQQRVGIARALVNQPALVLGDEPTGDLDPETAAHVLDVLYGVHREWNATVLLATHAADLVDRRKERVLRLEQGILTADVPYSGYLHGERGS